MRPPPILELVGLRKAYGAQKVLGGLDLTVRIGEVKDTLRESGYPVR